MRMLGKQLQAARKTAGYTQRALAEELERVHARDAVRRAGDPGRR